MATFFGRLTWNLKVVLVVFGRCNDGINLIWIWNITSNTEIVPVLDPDNDFSGSNMVLLYFVFKILSAGSEPNLFHWQLNGDPKAQVPCTPYSIFNIQVNSKSPKNKVIWSMSDSVLSANYQYTLEIMVLH